MQLQPPFKLIAVSLLLLALSACSMNKMMVNMSMPMIEGGIEAMNEEPERGT